MQLSYRYMSKYVFLIALFLNGSLFCGLDYGLHKNLDGTEENDPKSWAIQNAKKDNNKENDQKNSSGNRSPRERGKNPFFESLA